MAKWMQVVLKIETNDNVVNKSLILCVYMLYGIAMIANWMQVSLKIDTIDNVINRSLLVCVSTSFNGKVHHL